MYQEKKFYILLLAIAFILPMGVMGAWMLPVVAPPTGITPTPINASINYQQKGGDLAIGGELGALVQVSSPQFCIITGWSPFTTSCTRTVNGLGLGWKSVVEDFGIPKITAGEGLAVSSSIGDVTITSTGGDTSWEEGLVAGDIQNRNTGKVVIDGTLKFEGGTLGAGKILVSDAEGNATWENK